MTTFHPFPWLPYELRAQIWVHTVEPRVVDISVSDDYLFSGAPLPVTSTPVPAPLQACQESRRELQKHYQRAFSELHAPWAQDGEMSRYVWTNLDIDIIFIGTGWGFKTYKSIAPFIQRLQFEGEYLDSEFNNTGMDDLRLYTSAREIYVVCEDGLKAWDSALHDHYWPCGVENVWMIDPCDGTMMKGTEMERMFEQERIDRTLQMGYDPATQLPLRETAELSSWRDCGVMLFFGEPYN